MRLLLFSISLIILLYGLLRPEQPPELFNHSDKLWHLLGFGAVSLAARLAFIRAPAWLLWGTLALCAPLSEWLQHWLQPSRYFSWNDIYANLIGVLLAAIGWWLLTLLHKHWQNRHTWRQKL